MTETFGHPEGVLAVDESGIPNKGTKSVRAAKQYCGRLGKVENRRVGVFLAYTSPTGRAFLDRRPCLPEEWTDNAARCRVAWA